MLWVLQGTDGYRALNRRTPSLNLLTGEKYMNRSVDSKNRMIAALVAVIAGPVCWVGQVIAQEEPGTLQEVVVTAEKRSEDLQKVPLALSAYTSDYLENNGILDLTDLKAEIPSLTFFEYTAGQPRYYIRGIGNNLDSGSIDDDVGVFVDGVYMGRPAMSNTPFMDLDHVEVLRGPQGTLFGRNVVGGAISFVSKKPDQDVQLSGEVTYGNYNEIDTRAFASGPITGNLFGSISVATTSHDGYGINTTAGQGAIYPTTNTTPGAVTVNVTGPRDVGDTHFTGVRTTLRLVASDSLEFNLHADASDRTGSGTWAFLWLAGPITGPNGFPADGEQSHPWSAAHYPDVGVSDVSNDGVSLDVNWETWLGTLTSITAYRHSDYDSRLDECVLNVPDVLDPSLVTGDLGECYYEPTYRENNDQYSEEIRLASSANSPVKWVGGLYAFNAADWWSVVQSWAFFFPGFTGQGFFGDGGNRTVTNAYAAFANASYEIHKLTLQAGVRFSHDEKKNRGGTFGVNFTGPWTDNGVPYPAGVGYNSSASASWNAVTPSFSLSYQAAPDKFLYALVSRGFKSGGFGVELQDKVAAETPVSPEFAWNYEIGAKLEWSQRARLNVSAFWVDYTNLQVNGLLVEAPGEPPLSVLLNAGKTTSKGVESEGSWLLTPSLSINAMYTYTKTRINETNPGAAGVVNVGDELPNAPENKGYIGASYTTHVNDRSAVTLRADYSAQSSYASNLPNLADERVPSTRKVDAGLLFEGNNGHWGVELWGKNLTNVVHPDFLTDVAGTVYAKPIDPPRTYGFTIRLRN
jgi:iron complex outermembrane receptor protein